MWGSDWPHANHYDEMQNEGDQFDAFAQWAPEGGLRRQMLVAAALGTALPVQVQGYATAASP